MKISNELRDRAHAIAKAHGFHNEKQEPEHFLMLVITEIAEMVEADRKDFHASGEVVKDTVEDEIADIVIRLMDFCGEYNIDVDEFTIPEHVNPVRLPITQYAYRLTQTLVTNNIAPIATRINDVLYIINNMCRAYDIDVDKFVERKMKYNEKREMLNGKRY